MTHINNDLRHALGLMETALSLIDRTEVALEVGAQLDLAIHRLKQVPAVSLHAGERDGLGGLH